MSTTMTIRIDEHIKNQLGKLAESSRRSKSFLAAEAIKTYIECNEWQIQEIEAALVEADSGHFASDAEVHAVLEKWTANEN
ncbi:MAG: hypothetical protein Q9M22_07150 [Mariprofundaceae bacterium]|nr:hypothetical protein [Mariprofundaceae bacterium]